MEHKMTPLDTSDSIEDMLARAENILERFPNLTPMLAELIHEIDQCRNIINEHDALACIRFHAHHPALAEKFMHLVQVAREQGMGVRRALRGDDWSEEPTIPA